MQVIFLTSSSYLLHENTLFLCALFLYESLSSKGRGKGIGLESRCVIFCLRTECAASGYVA